MIPALATILAFQLMGEVAARASPCQCPARCWAW